MSAISYAPVTRQITLPTSSAVSTEPSAPIAICALLVLGVATVVVGIGVVAIESFDVPLVDPS